MRRRENPGSDGSGRRQWQQGSTDRASATDLLGLENLVLYRDKHIIVIDKPAGIPVHAGRKGGLTLEDGFEALRGDLPWRPELAHRLDRYTSGCLVLGRNREILAKLGHLFVNGRVEKVYWAIVEGAPMTETGRIALNLSKRTMARGWRMRADPKGKPAISHYKVLGRSERFTWLELTPKTGRTHQLRVHCAAKGWPILGDMAYGKGRAAGPRLHLHARAISIPLVPRQNPISVIAPVPEDMREALRLCGWGAEASA